MTDKQFDLPAIAQSVDPAIRNPMTRMREAIQTLIGTRGDGLDAAVTPRNAVASLGGTAGIGSSVGGGTVATAPDLTPPPTVTGLTMTAGFANVFVEWDAATYTQGHGHGQTNIYAAKKAAADPTLPTFSNAVRVYEATGALTIAALPSDLSIRWHLWAKWQTADGVESTAPAGGTNGVVAQTGKIGNVDLGPLIVEAGNLASNSVGATHLAANSIAVGSLAVQNGAIVNAMIGTAAIDDAKIANLSAAKLTIGDGTVGGNLKSTSYVTGSAGWIVQPGGFAEFSNVVVRGTVYATAGTFAGSLSAATGTFAGALSAATGTFAGTLSVGTTPALSGTTMTGSGAVINSGGTFAIGNTTGNITYNGTTLTLNGTVVSTGSMQANAATVQNSAFTGIAQLSANATGTSDNYFTVLSKVFTAAGGQIIVLPQMFQKLVLIPGNTADAYMTPELYVDSSIVTSGRTKLSLSGGYTTNDNETLEFSSLADLRYYTATLSAGSHTVELKIKYRKTSAGDTTRVQADSAALIIMEFKR